MSSEAISSLVADLQRRGVVLSLTRDGPTIEAEPGMITSAEARLLRAHWWQLWRYLPTPTDCLECQSRLPEGSKSWYCPTCCAIASKIRLPRTDDQEKGAA